mmetsp:Transcript_27201/g.40049  ORF Transcript_27201/g.40049 Transcript_27201/m.40049 type:complete len:362 (-) Transcript_27201:136-1221(-)
MAEMSALTQDLQTQIQTWMPELLPPHQEYEDNDELNFNLDKARQLPVAFWTAEAGLHTLTIDVKQPTLQASGAALGLEDSARITRAHREKRGLERQAQIQSISILANEPSKTINAKHTASAETRVRNDKRDIDHHMHAIEEPALVTWNGSESAGKSGKVILIREHVLEPYEGSKSMDKQSSLSGACEGLPAPQRVAAPQHDSAVHMQHKNSTPITDSTQCEPAAALAKVSLAKMLLSAICSPKSPATNKPTPSTKQHLAATKQPPFGAKLPSPQHEAATKSTDDPLDYDTYMAQKCEHKAIREKCEICQEDRATEALVSASRGIKIYVPPKKLDLRNLSYVKEVVHYRKITSRHWKGKLMA